MYLECSNLSTNPQNILDKLTEIQFNEKEMLENVKSQISNKENL